MPERCPARAARRAARVRGLLALLAFGWTLCVQAAAPATGDLHERYLFTQTNETIPYRMYVPHSYDGSRAYPLVVVLHGSSTTADDVMDVPGLKQIAERRDVILLAPQGYSAFGGYGDIYPVVVTREAASQVDALLAASRPGTNPPKGMTRPPANVPPATVEDYAELKMNGLTDPHVSQWSETDTLNVLARVRATYRIDPLRIYAHGQFHGRGRRGLSRRALPRDLDGDCPIRRTVRRLELSLLPVARASHRCALRARGSR